MKFRLLIVLILIVIRKVQADIESGPETTNSKIREVEGCSLKEYQLRYEVLPGMGWDNLRNVEMGRVLEPSYSGCRLSDDGKYLIPDSLILVPVKSSEVNLASEIFHKFTSYSSMTANSINVEADGIIHAISLGGSFSAESKYVRQNQYDTKSIVSRTQLRYQLYSANFQVDSPMNSNFRSRVMDIAEVVGNGKYHIYAEYLCDLLIRDFGTHVTTKTISGAILSKFDFIKRNKSSDMSNDTTSTSLSASAGFAKLLNISISISHSSSEASINLYENKIMQSRILSQGGPTYGANFSLGSWEKDLANNLVAVDRRGDPLHYLVTNKAFPELKHKVVYNTSLLIKKAIIRYYTANSVTGCTDIDAENFNPLANIDSNDCESPKVNFTLGGVFQTCDSKMGQLCNGFRQRNPITGDYSCSKGYQPVLIVAGNGPSHQTKDCIIFDYGCEYKTTESKYEGFWCSPKHDEEPVEGYLLGGVYTNDAVNPVTNSRSCPHNYMALKLGHDLHICASYDIELGKSSSLPFGGFFSCLSGNPLSVVNSIQNSKHLLNSKGTKFTKYWPKTCPPGYSRHVADIDNGCQVLYCIQAKDFNKLAKISIRRPPFIDFEDLQHVWNEEVEESQVVAQDGKVWLKASNGVWLPQEKKSMNPWMMATITLIVGIAFIALFVGGRFLHTRRLQRKSNAMKYRNMPDVNFSQINADGLPNYGTLEDVLPVRQTSITVPEES